MKVSEAASGTEMLAFVEKQSLLTEGSPAINVRLAALAILAPTVPAF